MISAWRTARRTPAFDRPRTARWRNWSSGPSAAPSVAKPTSTCASNPARNSPGASPTTFTLFPNREPDNRETLAHPRQRRDRPQVIRIVRTPVLGSSPVESVLHVENRRVLGIAGDAVHDAAGDQPHEARMRIQIGRAHV